MKSRLPNKTTRTQTPDTRWVVKLGTGILTLPGGRLDLEQIWNLVQQVAELKRQGLEIILVTSGAIGSGMGIMGLSQRPKVIETVQACAAIGQPYLMRVYEDCFRREGMHVAQILLTYHDLDSRTLYANTQKTLEHLLARRAFVPIINENDVIASEEIQFRRFGDNDQLSAHVAVLARASRLVILSNVPGMTQNRDGSGAVIRTVRKIDDKIEALAGRTQSETSVGGMITKINAAKMTTQAGIPMQIADGRAPNILKQIFQKRAIGTTFLP